MKRVVNFRLDDEELMKWRAAANAEGRTVSNWIVMKCREAIAEPAKNSTPEFTHQTYALPVGTLPRKTPLRRKHIDVREDSEEGKPPKKFRCSYLWPSNSKKCPRCHEVHGDV